jgi:rhodanese-related sulfurtransferase
MVPFDLLAQLGTWGPYAVALAIGVGFGATLESAGFGDSRKLAAQFYLGDMTVLKVMFTAIVVAAVLIHGASGLGLLDLERVFVNPTYLVPGIVGGLIMGVGFIIGGFCPGTSLVAASTLKLDGVAFLGGVGAGVFLFGETVDLFGDAWRSTFFGRFTLPELAGPPHGVVVLLLVLLALAMFFGAEIAEAVFGRGQRLDRELLRPRNRFHIAAGGTLAVSALLVMLVGQPDVHARWEALAGTTGIDLAGRAPYVHPGEVVEWMADPAVTVRILDVRSEGDFNLFHVMGSKRTTPDELASPDFLRQLSAEKDNTLFFVVSNGETDATAAWKVLAGARLANVYIVEGGVNNWLRTYPPDPCIATALPADQRRDGERLAFLFSKAVGHACHAAHPDARFKEPPTDCFLQSHPEIRRLPQRERGARPVPFDDKKAPVFERRVKLKKKTAAKGGCG